MDSYGNTALHLAAAQNDLTIASLLLLKGADINQANRSGVTPMVVAVRMGHSRLVKVMQKHGGIIPATEDRLRTSFVSLNQQSKTRIDEADVRKRAMSLPASHATGITRHQSAGTPVAKSGAPTREGIIRGNSQATMPAGTTSQATLRTLVTAAVDDGITLSQMSPVGSTGEMANLDDTLPKRRLPIYNAAYLGLEVDSIDHIPSEILSATDEASATSLMKAAYRGHVRIVEKLLKLGADANARDATGYTALTWASLNGHVEVVKVLLQMGRAKPDGVRASVSSAASASNGITPLSVAVYQGHVEVVEILLDNGADVNLRIGPGKGKSLVMIAAWTRRQPMVRLLIKRGAVVDPGVKEWLREGATCLKRMGLDMNAWLGSVAVTDAPATVPKGIIGVGSTAAERSRNSSYQTQLTQTESDEIAGVETAIEEAVAEAGPQDQVQNTEPQADVDAGSAPIARPRRNVGRRRGNAGFRQGLNLEKLLGANPELVVDLTERLPEIGTELDRLYIVVFQCIVQLVMAANNNIKHQYILISAKAIHHAGEIVRATEAIQRAHPSKPATASPPASNQATSQSIAALLFRSPVDSRFAELADVINVEMPKQLMLTTKIAVGVWPPPQAQSEMIKSAANLARACKTLTDLGNTTGFYPVLDKPLEVSFVPFEDSASAEAPPPAAEPEGLATNISYSEYKRQNDLKIIQMMSKRVDQPDSSSSLTDGLGSDDPDKQFFATLDAQLRQFVASVTELKRLHKEHLKQEYDNATNKVNERADSLMEEVKSFELLHDFPMDLTLSAEDGSRLVKAGVNLGQPIYPALLRPLWRAAFDEVQNTAYNLMSKGRLASGFLPHPTASDEMLQAALPCVRAVKKLVTLTKESTNKIRAIASEDQRKKDAWRREVMQNDHVKKLFQMWESQVLQKGVAGAGGEVGEEEKRVLEDGDEGLSLEVASGKRIVKGGRLTKLVEVMTSHLGTDIDFMAAFVITHHSFTTSLEMVDALMKRYDITPPYGLTKQKFDMFIQKKVFPSLSSAKRKVDDPAMRTQLLNMLTDKLEHPYHGPPDLLPPPSDASPPKSLLPKGISDLYAHLTSDERAFFDIDPLEMARQLTLVEFEHFRNVTPVECTDQIWGDKRKKEAAALGIPIWTGVGHATALEEMIKHTNILTSWISTNIVKWDTLKARVSALKYFCQFAVRRLFDLIILIFDDQHCRELNNFNGITAVNAAMSTAAVNRLHKTWEAFIDKHPKIHEAYEEVADVVTPKGQYANYRKVLKDLQPPAIPFLGVYLTDLTFIELGNPDFLPDSHFINFEKRRKVYTVIKDIQSFQRTAYSITPVQGILDFYQGLRMDQLKDADALYDLSLVVEPREESDDEDDM
ncbi:hypothetical protein HDV00_007624 [Rhizophlyctis rosea]|nr:hypothetical protein HDV00_007624 [Rhizophlyctis rosea]